MKTIRVTVEYTYGINDFNTRDNEDARWRGMADHGNLPVPPNVSGLGRPKAEILSVVEIVE
jgi:hypothetical protein